MPRKAMDYSKTIIYKIICNDNFVVECYVGHTTSFKDRKRQHKNACNNDKCNFKIYQMIREHGGWDNWSMKPICEYPCKNYIQACIKEEECRIELQASLNNNKCYANSDTKEYHKEYQQTHKEQITKKTKIRYELNKEAILEKAKEYRETHKEAILEKAKEYRETHKEQLKEYEQLRNQSEHRKEQRQIYLKENKDKINEQRRLKYAQKKLV